MLCAASITRPDACGLLSAAKPAYSPGKPAGDRECLPVQTLAAGCGTLPFDRECRETDAETKQAGRPAWDNRTRRDPYCDNYIHEIA